MGICAEELRRLVIRPTLKHLGEWSPAAENLLLGTAAQESGLGFHLKQQHQRGLGIFQIRPQTHRRIWDNYLVHHPDLASAVRGLASQHEFLSNPHAELATNLSYTTAIAWMIYRRNEKPLPTAEDTDSMGRHWRRHFQRNSHLSVEESAEDFTKNYRQYVQRKAASAA